MRRCSNEIDNFEYLLWQIVQQINRYTRRFLTREGLTMARFIALSALDPEKPITMGELQRRLCLAPATLTGLIDGLLDKDLVKRWRDDSDRRVVYLSPTAKGIDLIERVFAFRASVLTAALGSRHNIDLNDLNRKLAEILGYLNNMTWEGKRDE